MLHTRFKAEPSSDSSSFDKLNLSETLSLLLPGDAQHSGVNLDEDVLCLLGCVCRHPLLLAEVTPSGLRSLPIELFLTLLLIQQEFKPHLQRLLRASSYPGVGLAGNRGTVVDLYGPKTIFCGNDAAVNHLGGGAIHVSLPPSQSQSSALG
jgi:hypothetical protein